MKTAIIPVEKLVAKQISRMFEIMNSYYNNIEKEQFQKDLSEKDSVILLSDRQGVIQGFSTLLSREMEVHGKKVVCLYSGDTVMDKAYWGNGALGIAFVRNLVRVKLKNLFRPVYWFLISKGYKTYLLMANNFSEHYPRYEKQTPANVQAIMNAFYEKKFAPFYRPELNLVEPLGKSCALKVTVADIDMELLKVPRIRFFAEKNPRWQEGTELTCIARVSLWVPLRYGVKRLYKFLQKPLQDIKTLPNQMAHHYPNDGQSNPVDENPLRVV